MDLRKLLQDVKDGSTNIDDALSSLKNLPYEDIGYANIDHHREIRNGYPEVIYCEGKNDEHILGIIGKMIEKKSNIDILDLSSFLFFLKSLSNLSIYFLFNSAELPSLNVI